MEYYVDGKPRTAEWWSGGPVNGGDLGSTNNGARRNRQHKEVFKLVLYSPSAEPVQN